MTVKCFAETFWGRVIFAGPHPMMWEGADVTLDELSSLGIRNIISLEERKSSNLKEKWLELGSDHQHLTSDDDVSFFIKDFEAPSIEALDKITQCVYESAQLNISSYIHCRGGLGRTGTVLAALLIKYQEYDTADAINFVRKNYESCAIETNEQEQCLVDFKAYVDEQMRNHRSRGCSIM